MVRLFRAAVADARGHGDLYFAALLSQDRIQKALGTARWLWPAAVMGLFKQGPGFPSRGESALGLPADFLIGGAGQIVAVKYGKHASDQWEVDEVLELAAAQPHAPPDGPASAAPPLRQARAGERGR